MRAVLKKMGNQNGWPRPPAIDGIKFFDNDDQAAKPYCCLPTITMAGNSNVLQPDHHCQKEALPPVLISHLFSMAFLAATFFTPGVFWLGFHFFFYFFLFIVFLLKFCFVTT